MNTQKIIIAFCLLIFGACKSENKKLIDNIATLENELKYDTTGLLNYQKAADIVKLYEQYVEKFPDDTLSVKYLYRAADVSAHSHNAKHSIDLYKKLIEKYPLSEYVPQSYFFIGFLNENELKNTDEASKAYKTLLEKFPDYEQKETVEWLMQNLGKSDADLVKQFEANQQKADSLVADSSK